MKKKIMKWIFGAALFVSPLVNAQTDSSNVKTIKLGLLLDTSSSMDGLIEQTKSQLWKIINKMASATYNGETPNIMIALYEYGNSGLSAKTGFIRQVTGLTSDLDLLSKDLFSLHTNGGDEYCGQVIQTAFKDLDWGTTTQDLQMIFIAGNEPFNQGSVDFKEVCQTVKNHDITINTIFCGNRTQGIATHWKKGADLGEGKYFNINQNAATVYAETPYDSEIDSLSEELNKTYVYYGSQGQDMFTNQMIQDSNAKKYGRSNNALRAISKSSKVYRNTSWDLIDASGEADFDISEVDKETLPDSLQALSDEAIQKEIDAKRARRKFLQVKIQDLAAKRDAYIAETSLKNSPNANLDAALLVVIEEQGKKKGFVFK